METVLLTMMATRKIMEEPKLLTTFLCRILFNQARKGLHTNKYDFVVFLRTLDSRKLDSPKEAVSSWDVWTGQVVNLRNHIARNTHAKLRGF